MAARGEQGSGGIDHTLVVHKPGGGAGVLGLLVFLGTEVQVRSGLPPHWICSWPEVAPPDQLRQHQPCCVTLGDVLSFSGL